MKPLGLSDSETKEFIIRGHNHNIFRYAHEKFSIADRLLVSKLVKESDKKEQILNINKAECKGIVKKERATYELQFGDVKIKEVHQFIYE